MKERVSYFTFGAEFKYGCENFPPCEICMSFRVNRYQTNEFLELVGIFVCKLVIQEFRH